MIFSRRSPMVLRRLIVLVAIPTMLGLALAGLQVSDEMHSAAAYAQIDKLAVLGQQAGGLAQAMEDERAAAAAFIAAGRPASGLAALHRREAATDGWAATVRRLASGPGRGLPARSQASAAGILASIAELPGLRRQAVRSQVPATTVISGYSAAIARLSSVDDGIADLSGSSALSTGVRTLGSLSGMKDQASQQEAILGGALAQGRFGPGALTALTIARAQQASDLASFRSSATPEESGALTDILGRPLPRQARALEQRAAAAGDGELALGSQAGQHWRAGMSYTISWMQRAEQQLATWIAAYAQALQRTAMRSAIITGGASLAVLIVVILITLIIARSLARPLRRLQAAAPGSPGVRLPARAGALDAAAADLGPPLLATPVEVQSAIGETGRAGRAPGWMSREAVRPAGEEARRGGTGAVYGSFFWRSHSLLERLLGLIDRLELGEGDPERLAGLFQMDHLATRLRRNSDSALVLAGHEAPPRWTGPVALVDLLRGAVSEVDQYDRVAVSVQQDACVSGSAAADIAHLLAELLDNAITFSPGTTPVIMSGHAVAGDGSLISIADSGPGMSDEQLRQLNWQLAHPELADLTDGRHIGLLAVARLAARHGINVALGPSPAGGTAAEVHLPGALVVPDAGTGGWPGPDGETPWARDGQETVAGLDPEPAAPARSARCPSSSPSSLTTSRLAASPAGPPRQRPVPQPPLT